MEKKSSEVVFRGHLSKFIPRTSDLADFLSGPRGPQGPRDSPGWSLASHDFNNYYSKNTDLSVHFTEPFA